MPSIDFRTLIDVLGTVAFAVSGASHAIEKKLDIFGVLIIAFVTSIGGGTLRDMLLGDLPVNWLRNELIIGVILGAALLTVFIKGLEQKIPNTLFLFDSLGLGLFTLVGMDKGFDAGFPPGICIALGTITACFGGVIRDVLLNQVPLIFHKEIYASACIAGGSLLLLLQHLHVKPTLAEIICIISIVCIRIVAVKYKLTLLPIRETKHPS
ncbi:MAG TPA: trimeric intracellular cation channel family protein [Phnomibacter sp.]|nr:trimeric intracellular cation channel family protein [Phnomibacter sp.]